MDLAVFRGPGVQASKKETVDFADLLLDDIRPEYRSQCEAILNGEKDISKKTMWSRSFEDWYVYHNFFRDRQYHIAKEDAREVHIEIESMADADNFTTADKKGVYLDIGSIDPLKNSISAFFDLCLGWAGMCIWGPDAAVNMYTRSARSCNPVSTECLWEPFGAEQGDATVCTAGRDTDMSEVLDKYPFYDRSGYRYSFGKEVKEIDLVVLTVDGQELEFLACWPFDEITVKVWLISNRESKAVYLDNLMFARGYTKQESLSYQAARPRAVYVKKESEVPWTKDKQYRFHQNVYCN